MKNIKTVAILVIILTVLVAGNYILDFLLKPVIVQEDGEMVIKRKLSFKGSGKKKEKIAKEEEEEVKTE